MAAIFCIANLHLKQGIDLLFVMADFIFMGLLDLWRARTENYKLKRACPQWDSNPVPSANEAISLSVVLLEQIFIEHLNVDRIKFYLIVQLEFTVPCTMW